MPNNAYTRQAATERAVEVVTCNPLNMNADDGATVVHVFGRNPVLDDYEDKYIALGGAHDQIAVDKFYAPSTYQAIIVSVHYREGDTCAEAVRKACVHGV